MRSTPGSTTSVGPSVPHPTLEPTAAGIARNLGLAYLSLASSYDEQTQRAELIRALRRANHLAPNPQIEPYLRVLEQGDRDSAPMP